MSIQVQSIFRFCKCANAVRPMRRLLLSGFPLVLTTRYFGMIGSRPYAVATNFQPASVLANEASGTSDRAGKSREGSGRAQRELTRYKTATASEKLFQCKDLSPACRERNRAHRCNRCSVRRDWSRNHSCPAPASRSANRLPSWKQLGSPSACYVRSAARSLQELLLRLALWLRSESQWPPFARACFRAIVLCAAAR